MSSSEKRGRWQLQLELAKQSPCLPSLYQMVDGLREV